MLYTILIFLFIIVSALMTVSILMQSAKGGGLAASFGGAGGGGGVLGPRGAANFFTESHHHSGFALTFFYVWLSDLSGRPTASTAALFSRNCRSREAITQPAALPTAPIQGRSACAGRPRKRLPKRRETNNKFCCWRGGIGRHAILRG